MGRSRLFQVVQYSLYLSLILAKGVTRCSPLFVMGWCTNWCKSVYVAFDLGSTSVAVLPNHARGYQADIGECSAGLEPATF
jgi:hypothetical protein